MRLFLPEADTEDQARQVAGGFEAWVRKKVIEEAGYDRIVREILTARLDGRAVAGRVVPSPAGYYTAKEGKPENIASGVARVFLGIRLECAQCHNHPFASWKREQFWSLAAFFADVPPPLAEDAVIMRRDPDAAPRRELTIPGTKKVVKASHLDGSTPEWRPRALHGKFWPSGSPLLTIPILQGPSSIASGLAFSGLAWSNRWTISTEQQVPS